jgi:3-deoxy-7-phosphoheptulonate synthase
LDLSAVPLIKSLSHLPIVVDPSHGTGCRNLVPSMSLAAIAAGADGLMVEVHPNPYKALSDGEQSLTLMEFAALMDSVRQLVSVLPRRVS